MELLIDQELKNLIPPLSSEEYGELEKSILAEGCRDAIVTWNGTIVDGHNRYEICTKHGIAFKTIDRQFADKGEAAVWMVKNQIARRNVEKFVGIELLEKAAGLSIAEKNREKMMAGVSMNPGLTSAQGQDRDYSTRTDYQLAALAGVGHDTYHKAKVIIDKAPEELKQQLRSGEVSINQAYKTVRETEKKEERKKAIETKIETEGQSIDLYHPDKKYRVIYADPPWQYNDKQNTSSLGGAEKYYPTMSIDEIANLPVKELCEKDAVLFLWVTSPMLEDCFKVINGWGFHYKSSFVWDKVLHAMGHYNSVRHEFLLIAVKGSCTPDVKKLLDSVVSIERTEHSKKPDEFRDMIDELYPIGNRLEMFARVSKENWDCWGNMV